MKPTKVICHHCHGSGKIWLSPVLQATLEAIDGKPQATQDIARRLGDQYVKTSAINNRLSKLHRLGKVVAEKRGKTIYWSTSK